jgi:phosphoribosylglycinamide formyltransferase-1
MQEQFVGEPIQPVGATLDTSRMAAGEPGLPREFQWGERQIRIVEVRRSWKETGPCRHGSGEQYVRKHWYEVLTASDGVMQIYFERQPRGGRKTTRWWLFTVSVDQ